MKTFKSFIDSEHRSPYFKSLQAFIDEEYRTKTIFPPYDSIYNAFSYCDYEDIKVVIIGQDPYHELHQANGLAFSVERGVKIPPSLRNMYKEAHDDVGIEIPTHGDLTSWAKQGVLLLNAVLTVEEGHANAHANKGWEIFTDHVIALMNERDKPLVFILWGKNAMMKEKMIDTSKHAIIKSAHPSPLSAYRGFFGSKPFSRTNDYLKEWQEELIDWSVK